MNLNIKVLNCCLLLLICTFSIITCSQEQKKTLNKDKFASVLSELMTIENMAVADSTKARLVHKSLNKHNISIDKLKLTIDEFADNPEYWQTIYNMIKENLKKDSKKIEY